MFAGTLRTSKHGLFSRINDSKLLVRSFGVRLPPRLKIKEEDIKESFLKGSGPGGQKINKTASAVQLTHLPSGLVVKCQATRSRTQNREMARRLLADRVEENEKGDQSRTSLKVQIKSKKKASKTKKARRKYRKLESEADGDEEEVGRADLSEEGQVPLNQEPKGHETTQDVAAHR